MLANERRTIRSEQLEKRGRVQGGEREREKYVDLWQHTRCTRDSFCFPSFIRIQTLHNIQILFDCEKRLANLVEPTSCTSFRGL